jgi:prophage regulatory protein
MTDGAQLGRFMRLPEVREKTGLSRATIYRMISAGGFPKQAKLSAQCSGWWSTEVEAWSASRIAEAHQN